MEIVHFIEHHFTFSDKMTLVCFLQDVLTQSSNFTYRSRFEHLKTSSILINSPYVFIQANNYPQHATVCGRICIAYASIKLLNTLFHNVVMNRFFWKQGCAVFACTFEVNTTLHLNVYILLEMREYGYQIMNDN